MNTNTISNSLKKLSQQLGTQIVGQQHVINGLLIALIADGHVLLEGLPGTAKTRSVRALAHQLTAQLGRIQFTPDLMPSDVIGYDSIGTDGDIEFKKGPVFTNILLADEINRAPPKVQSALLEAMGEHQITVGGQSHMLPTLFMVLATQNPIEQEGTYPLPEAQLDRFLMKITINYPSRQGELAVLRLVKNEEKKPPIIEAIDSQIILDARKTLIDIHVSDRLESYIVDLIMATRDKSLYPDSPINTWIRIGSSPRATIALERCARAHAFLNGKEFVDPDDVRAVADAVLAHRISLSYDAIADGINASDVVAEIIKTVRVS